MGAAVCLRGSCFALTCQEGLLPVAFLCEAVMLTLGWSAGMLISSTALSSRSPQSLLLRVWNSVEILNCKQWTVWSEWQCASVCGSSRHHLSHSTHSVQTLWTSLRTQVAPFLEADSINLTSSANCRRWSSKIEISPRQWNLIQWTGRFYSTIPRPSSKEERRVRQIQYSLTQRAGSFWNCLLGFSKL